MRVPSPIPLAPASSFSTGKNLVAIVPVPFIPSNLPVPLMISSVLLAAVGVSTPGPAVVPSDLMTIVEPSEKVMIVYRRNEAHDSFDWSPVRTPLSVATSPFSNTKKDLRVIEYKWCPSTSPTGTLSALTT